MVALRDEYKCKQAVANNCEWNCERGQNGFQKCTLPDVREQLKQETSGGCQTDAH